MFFSDLESTVGTSNYFKIKDAVNEYEGEFLNLRLNSTLRRRFEFQ